RVVDAQDGPEIGEQVLPGQKLADHLADHRGAPETAAHEDAGAERASFAVHDVEADVVHLRGSLGVFRTTHGDLELARQVGEFRMKGRPLADQFAPGTAVFKFKGRNARELVCGGIAYAVAAGLDRVHFHLGQLLQDGGNLFQLRPVQL